MLALLAAAVLSGKGSGLETKVSFHQTYLSFADFCASITKQSGLKLSVRKGLEDRKLVIVCKDRPAREVLAKFAETFGGSWSEQSGVLKFDLTPAVQDAERIAIHADDERLRERLTWFMSQAVTVAGQTPDARAQSGLKAQAELSSLQSQGVKPEDRRWVSAQATADSYTDQAFARIGGLVAGQETSVIDTLCAGKHYFYIPDGNDLSAAAATTDILSLNHDGGKDYLDDARLSNFGISGEGRGLEGLPCSRQPLKIDTLIDQWASKKDQSVLEHALRRTEANAESPYEASSLSAPDQLINLADRSGVPIIGDGFRTYRFRAAWLSGDIVADWLEQFGSKPKEVQSRPRFRSSDGWLLVRSGQYWNYLESEVPERLLRPMELKQASTGLTLSDYIEFSRSLTRKQARQFDESAVCFSTMPIRFSYDALLFLAGLGDQQLAQMEQGTLDVLALSPEQRYPLREALFYAGSVNTTMLREVFRDPDRNSYLTVHFRHRPGLAERWKERVGMGSGPPRERTWMIFDGGSAGSFEIPFLAPTAPG